MSFFLVGFTSHQHCEGNMATFQLYWWRKTSGALRVLFQERTSRTTDVSERHMCVRYLNYQYNSMTRTLSTVGTIARLAS